MMKHRPESSYTQVKVWMMNKHLRDMMGSLLVQSVGQASHRLRVFKFLPTGNIMEMLTFW